jgi:hypothetical protein
MAGGLGAGGRGKGAGPHGAHCHPPRTTALPTRSWCGTSSTVGTSLTRMFASSVGSQVRCQCDRVSIGVHGALGTAQGRRLQSPCTHQWSGHVVAK